MRSLAAAMIGAALRAEHPLSPVPLTPVSRRWRSKAITPPLPSASCLAELNPGTMRAVPLLAEPSCSGGALPRTAGSPGSALSLQKLLQLSRCFYLAFSLSSSRYRTPAVFGKDRDVLPRAMALPPQMPSRLSTLMLSVASRSKYPTFVPPALRVAVCACCQADLCEITEFLILFVLKQRCKKR